MYKPEQGDKKTVTEDLVGVGSYVAFYFHNFNCKISFATKLCEYRLNPMFDVAVKKRKTKKIQDMALICRCICYSTTAVSLYYLTGL